MLTFCMVTLTTSAIDSLSPIALAQQFILQGLVREKTNILFFIMGIGMTNFAAGMLAYYGISAFFRNVLASLLSQYAPMLGFAETALGFFCLFAAARMMFKKGKEGPEQSNDAPRTELDKLGAASLFLMGVVFCGFELTSALPYFGFLAFLLKYSLSLAEVLITLLVYNVIYSLPLIILYACYSRYQEKIDRFYALLQRFIGRVSAVAVPVAVLLIGVFFTAHGIAGIL